MTRKAAAMMALAGVVVLILAAWHVGVAAGQKQTKSKAVLPPAAAAAVKKAFPKATVGRVEREREGVVLYEVALKENGKEFEVELAADGQIVEVARKVTKANLPEPVAKTLAKLSGDAKVGEIERTETHAAVKLVKLGSPQVAYEAEFARNGKKVEVEIAEDGRLLGTEVDDDDDDDNGDDDDDDGDDDGTELSLDQVPAAVKATILKEAGTNKIEEVELHTRSGVKVYEAEWTAGGKEIEITVASDGKLLGREVEEEDDD